MPTATAAILKEYLGGFRYDLTDEASIQKGLALALGFGRFVFKREASLTPSSRLDFLVQGVAIEVKRQGPLGALLRQLSRYADHAAVRELLVVTARLQSTDVPGCINGKPVECLVLWSVL